MACSSKLDNVMSVFSGRIWRSVFILIAILVFPACEPPLEEDDDYFEDDEELVHRAFGKGSSTAIGKFFGLYPSFSTEKRNNFIIKPSI